MLAAGALQVLQVADVQIADEDRRLARAQPGDAHQVEGAERELLAQLVQVAQAAGVHQLGDLLGDGLAHAGHLAERAVLDPLVQAARRRRVGRQRVEGVRAQVVGAHLERVLSLDLQELGDLPQRLGHLPRRHGAECTMRSGAAQPSLAAPCQAT